MRSPDPVAAGFFGFSKRFAGRLTTVAADGPAEMQRKSNIR
jgi:hypothetical protein